MYFQIENTPEHIRRARCPQKVKGASPKEPPPRLVLAPFSRPPQVVFENVPIGATCERDLEVFNPSKQVQQITLGRALPPGLLIQLPSEWLTVEPESAHTLSLTWTPLLPTALRETVRFTNENRGRYDIIVVLKSLTLNPKGKTKQKPKSFKVSPPGKMKMKMHKKSPVATYKKKSEAIFNSRETYDFVQPYKMFKSSNKENIPEIDDKSIESYPAKCPFASPDFTFNTSEIFSTIRKTSDNVLQNTFDTPKMFSTIRKTSENVLQNTFDKPCNLNNAVAAPVQNVLKQCKESTVSGSDLFDNLTFTPLKTTNAEKLNKGPKIVLTVNSESDFEDSLYKLDHKQVENETRSIVCTSSQPPNQWLTVEHQNNAQIQSDTQTLETAPQNKKIPNTSSPKEMSSPNFSIYTDFSRISELSFQPQRFSTERKDLPKYENREMYENPNEQMDSNTYTKESPNTSKDYINQMFDKPPHFFLRDQPKSRQALFKESMPQKGVERNYYNHSEASPWQNELRSDLKSPRSSLSPPLQSIPEESTQISETHVLDRTESKMSTFTINKTFEKPEKSSISAKKRQTWTKTSIGVEPELWKIPFSVPKKSLKPKPNAEIESGDSLSSKLSATFNMSKHDLSITSKIGNVYSQAATVDPFTSDTYFYDKEAVDKFETEFKRWLNCILTPPADLESNVEQNIDVGKVWIDNRNKEVPLAPTKEQVSSKYHDSQRLAKLRRSAKAMLNAPEMIIVIQKLNTQIEKKLIAIRTDRNLHLDIGLQKAIMEILLSYNPLWLRIGLEAIYGTVLPLKSNSDVEGLTTFIIQRLFRNPFLKNKHSKSNAPNMLLPAYMEAIKKFTLKKFFILVLFLDQAKEKKLIPHDPCLFCRNAICKESREIIIRFTRELIAGIGDITRHLRPLGYVVTHKQSYLDEYKFAVHNLALDIRDGVRLTKVMEIILIKDGLLKQLRTPAISRLQKIHNVQVALTALKEANFVINGDITATDVADGHREKTLSLLWQLIHEFRAPLFEKAANVIQCWWRMKYQVILEKRVKEEMVRQKRHLSASIIQNWWRTIQYNRMLEWQRQRYIAAVIVIQKYWRMALHRNHYLKTKANVLKIEQWYLSLCQMRLAKLTLQNLKEKHEELRRKSAVIIQATVRRFLCMQRFKATIRKVIIVQSFVRCYVAKQAYLRLQKAVRLIQEKYRGKLQMREEIQKLKKTRESATAIQSWYRMLKQRKMFLKLKNSVRSIEDRYIALLKMREEKEKYRRIKLSTVLIQTRFRANKTRQEFTKKKNAIVTLQRKIRAHLLMKKERTEFFILRNATVILQRHIKSYLLTKKTRQAYLTQRKAAICIQNYYRSNKLAKTQRQSYVALRNAATVLQIRYRSRLAMREERCVFLKLKIAAIVTQRRYRAKVLMKSCKKEYTKLRNAAIVLQTRFRAKLSMLVERSIYMKVKSAAITIQTAYRALVLARQQRLLFLKKKQAAIKIQTWLRNCRKGKEIKQEYIQTKQACVVIQRVYRAYIMGRKQRLEFIKIKTATICIQKYYRSYLIMKTVRNQYIQLKEATVTIQRRFKSHLATKKQRHMYLQMKSATETIQRYFRSYLETKMVRKQYVNLKTSTIILQKRYRSLRLVRKERTQYTALKKSVITIQQKYRAILAMRVQRLMYMTLKSAAITIQRRFRAQTLMKKEKKCYITIKKACVTIQTYFRAYKLGQREKFKYIQLRKSAILIQSRYKALLEMRKERQSYMELKKTTIALQRRFRARQMMSAQRNKYQKILKAATTIQKAYKAYVVGKQQRNEYLQLKSAVVVIQKWIRNLNKTKIIRTRFLELKKATVTIQRRYKIILLIREEKRKTAALIIQQWYRATKKRIEIRTKFLKLKKGITILQALFRMKVTRNTFLRKKRAAIAIQTYYRSYKLTVLLRTLYQRRKLSIIKIQAFARMVVERKKFLRMRSAALKLQAAYRLKKKIKQDRELREKSAICVQKNIRRYLAQKRYQRLIKSAILIQNLWRGKLMTRFYRCEFMQKRKAVVRIQALLRGCWTRRHLANIRQQMALQAEERRKNMAAITIQAFCRGYLVRARTSVGAVAMPIRQRWRHGALVSKQESLRERHDDAMIVLKNISDIESVIRAFRSLELLTEVLPMMYAANASAVVLHVHIYMSNANRSVPSVEVLKSAAAVLVNLTRCSHIGPNIYSVTRSKMQQILKYMWRFSSNDPELICILCTHLWLFKKYPEAKEGLKECLMQPDNHKMLTTVKENVERLRRMTSNARNYAPKPTKRVSLIGHNYSLGSNKAESVVLPALEPDYGLTKANKPKYFKTADDAITCLFKTYDL